MICEIILLCAMKYNVKPLLLASIIHHESAMHVSAINDGARIKSYGLGQLTERTARKECGVLGKDIMDPGKNLDCSAKVLAHLLKRYKGDQVKAISAYNAGHFSQYNKQYVRSVQSKAAINICRI